MVGLGVPGMVILRVSRKMVHCLGWSFSNSSFSPLQALSRAFLRLNELSLIIFDECCWDCMGLGVGGMVVECHPFDLSLDFSKHSVLVFFMIFAVKMCLQLSGVCLTAM